ncbi:UNVERIFIED_CONTAM: hypothetical protein NCL1_42116 [Trichonephila clavipes]
MLQEIILAALRESAKVGDDTIPDSSQPSEKQTLAFCSSDKDKQSYNILATASSLIRYPPKALMFGIQV